VCAATLADLDYANGENLNNDVRGVRTEDPTG
jgi:hypothetical protein